MKNIWISILMGIFIFVSIGCSKPAIAPALDAGDILCESTISPNAEYVENEADQVFDTVTVYRTADGVRVASGSNSAFAKDRSYDVEIAGDITKDDIDIEWRTLTGETVGSKENQLALAVVTIRFGGEIVSEETISFIGKAVDLVADTVSAN